MRRANLAFFLVGPMLEAGVAPWLLTGGFSRGGGAFDHRGVVVVGWAIAALAIAAIAGCFAALMRAGGTPSPLAPTRGLVTGGPYARVRNPMYLATALLIAAEGLALAQWILLAAAAAYLAVFAVLVPRVEEPALAERFGAAYDAYRDRVPRWLPH